MRPQRRPEQQVTGIDFQARADPGGADRTVSSKSLGSDYPFAG
jgi:hypothetical protein